MRITPYLISVSLLTLAPCSGLAQDSRDRLAGEQVNAASFKTAAQMIEKEEAPSETIQIVQNQSNEASFGPVPSSVSVEADQDGEAVNLTFGNARSTYGGQFRNSQSIKFSAPFNKSAGRGDLLTTTGLPDAYSVEGSYSFRLFKPSEAALNTQIDESYRRVDRKIRELRQNCKKQKAKEMELGFKGKPKFKSTDCAGDVKLIPGFETLKAEINAAFGEIENFFLDQEFLSLQITGSVGIEEFDYRDLSTLAEVEDDRTVASASISLMYLPSLRSNIGYFGGVNLKKDYELPDSEIRCPTAASTDSSIACFEAAFGPPEVESEPSIFAGLRFLGVDAGIPIGGELRLAINPDDGEWSAEAPIYLVRNSKNELNSGIRFAYDSENDDFTFGIFVGKSFPGLTGI